MVYNTLEEIQKDFPDVKVTEELDNSEWSNVILNSKQKSEITKKNG
jgi:hypothetical protein